MKRGTKISLAWALMGLAAAIGCGCGSAAAQDASPSAIVLPARIVAGETATLAVLDSAGRLVPNATVEVPGRSEKITTDETGRATFTMPTAPAPAGTTPSNPGVLTVRLPGGADFTAPVIAATAGTPPVPSLTGGAKATRAPGIVFPRGIALGDRFAIEGAGFRGDASLDHVFLGNQEALVLAASPVDLVVLPDSRTPLGKTRLIVQVNGRRLAQEAITVVSIGISGPSKALAAQEKGVLIVEVKGTRERVPIEVRNLSPEVVRLPRGNEVVVTTSGRSPNIAKVEITGVRPGDYAVSARLAPGAAASR